MAEGRQNRLCPTALQPWPLAHPRIHPSSRSKSQTDVIRGELPPEGGGARFAHCDRQSGRPSTELLPLRQQSGAVQRRCPAFLASALRAYASVLARPAAMDLSRRNILKRSAGLESSFQAGFRPEALGFSVRLAGGQ